MVLFRAVLLAALTLLASPAENNIALMMRLTDLRNDEGSEVLSDVWRGVAMGAIIGVKDWNERNDRYTPTLSSPRYANCDVTLNPTMYDTGSTSKGSIMAYRAARSNLENPDGTSELHSILGAARSDASKPMATLGGIDGVPQMSYWSTSDAMEDKSVYTNFGRTIPPDSATTKAAAELMSKLGYTYIGVSYVDDPYGAFWKDAFVAACSAMKCKDASGKPTAESCPIQVITSGLIGGNKESVEQSVEIMKSANVKVGFIVTYDDDMNFFMDKAVAEGMVGGDYFWVFADGIMASAVVAAANIDPLRAHGHARLTATGGLVGNPNYDKFLNDWLNNFDNDVGLKAFAEELFWDYTADAGSQMNYDAGAAGGWHPEGTDLSVVEDSFFQDNFPDDLATYAYDAAMALGFGACDYVEAGGTFGAAFDGPAYFKKITELRFKSVTGNPYFLDTGSRDPESANFVLENFLCDDGGCVAKKMAKWTAADGYVDDVEGEPFVYADGTTTPPPDVPAEEMKKVMITKEQLYALAFAVVFGGVLAYALFSRMSAKKNTNLATHSNEIRHNATVLGFTVMDLLSDVLNWYAVVSFCTGSISAIYLAILGISALVASHSCFVNFKQVKSLAKELAEVTLGDAVLDTELDNLERMYPDVKVKAGIIKGGRSAAREVGALIKATFVKNKVQPTVERQSSAVLGEGVEVKEKRLLRVLKRIKNLKHKQLFWERKKVRVVSGALSSLVEDLPFTILNTLYIVYGCSLGFGDDGSGESEDGHCRRGGDSTLTLFMFSTIATIAFASKKLVDVGRVPQMSEGMRLLETFEIPHELESAKDMLDEINDRRAGTTMMQSAKLVALVNENERMKRRLSLVDGIGDFAEDEVRGAEEARKDISEAIGNTTGD
ncbi:hypothetical protein TeGR_g290 [Tetraparma gracilis]|uniref:Receptor ligand binding region domain-containing protein n=1 Tax=Tetraparma gracilis TaxID=2962635 RepID=A0ABQ6MDY1_9STRA|nr:hypothetical protein TeGR_g290 [Tetraparma gracilis]